MEPQKLLVAEAKDQDYANSYGAFLKYSSQAVAQIELLSKNIHIAKCLHADNAGDKIKVLSIGAGRGEFDMMIIDMLKRELATRSSAKTIEYTVVEPNKEFIAIFQERVKASRETDDVIFNWHACTFEEFETQVKDNSKGNYELIFFVQSIYYLIDLASSLSFACKELLSIGGCAFIIAAPEAGRVLRVAEHLEKMEGIVKKSIPNSIQDVDALRSKFNSFAFTRSDATHPVIVSSIFDEKSRDGNYLLDFFTHATNFRQNFEQAKVDDILLFIKEMSVKDGDDLIIHDDVVLISVSKNS